MLREKRRKIALVEKDKVREGGVRRERGSGEEGRKVCWSGGE